jgi:hypothetical protein
MKNYIVYQTKDKVWIIQSENWNRLQYEREIKPIRLALLDLTDEAEQALAEILQDNIEEFVELLNEELDNQCLYMN